MKIGDAVEIHQMDINGIVVRDVWLLAFVVEISQHGDAFAASFHVKKNFPYTEADTKWFSIRDQGNTWR